MLSDGALRMIVLLHFHTIGFNPLQLAYLFLLYELFGMITCLTAGWLTKKIGLNITLYLGLTLQIISILLLTLIDKSWDITLAIVFVMSIQGISGIAKDLTKISAKSSIKLVFFKSNKKLFKWVALITGSKNSIKGLGFFIGTLLLTFYNFNTSLYIMAIVLFLVLVFTVISIPSEILMTIKSTKFIEVFSIDRNINLLSLSRVFLFGARDIWLVVGLPVFLYSLLSDGSKEANYKAFLIIGIFMASWTILYGLIQSLTPKILSETKTIKNHAKFWSNLLILIPLMLIVLNIIFQELELTITILLLFIYGFIFAVNSSIHSFLILSFTNKDRVSLDVGFYYMSNAFGRLIGTFLSGFSYQTGGFYFCLFLTSIFLFFNRLSLAKIIFK